MPRPVPDWMLNHPRAKYLIARWVAQPEWANKEEMRRIYQEAKRCGGHVDHIVPLCSPIVCGLHVEHNLQIIQAWENYAKGNHYWPDMPDERQELFPLEECEQYELAL